MKVDDFVLIKLYKNKKIILIGPGTYLAKAMTLNRYIWILSEFEKPFEFLST